MTHGTISDGTTRAIIIIIMIIMIMIIESHKRRILRERCRTGTMEPWVGQDQHGSPGPAARYRAEPHRRRDRQACSRPRGGVWPPCPTANGHRPAKK